jgi:hypothetical protein
VPEELAARRELQDEVQALGVAEGGVQPDQVGVAGRVESFKSLLLVDHLQAAKEAGGKGLKAARRAWETPHDCTCWTPPCRVACSTEMVLTAYDTPLAFSVHLNTRP